MLRWRGMEVSGGFLLLWALLYYLDGQGVVPWCALAALLHELGHYLAIRAFGGQVSLLRLTCTGAEMVLSARRPLSGAGQLWAALAGPGINLVLALLSARLPAVLGARAYLFAGINLALALFNLLPVRQLDGGRALEVVLARLLTGYRAERVMGTLSLGLALALTAAGTVLVLREEGSFTLLLTALWLLRAAAPGKKREKKRKFCLHSG